MPSETNVSLSQFQDTCLSHVSTNYLDNNWIYTDEYRGLIDTYKKYEEFLSFQMDIFDLFCKNMSYLIGSMIVL